MGTAKMKHLWPLLAWILLSSHPAESRNGLGHGLRREVFFLNLEDGYFGCQVNESTDVLQLLELSKLCDQRVDCYQGADEQRGKLKCTDDCTKDGTKCQNGVCLDSVCHCNDGFGGCNCQVPDENECKYRPCDIFAHCTNTLGSFQCSCFPGYRGDGFHCEDINECDDPALAGRCVENAECCNLPSNFLCKCKPGYIGDGEVHCEDVNECTIPGACGDNTVCHNIPGNYTCTCQDGFTGDPYDSCVDINECEYEDACGRDALCVNLPGAHKCECPAGYDGSPEEECRDVDECLRSPCGRSALCTNVHGSFRCSCPDGMDGDPWTGCHDIDECTALENPCGRNAICKNADPGYNCLCPPGYSASPNPTVACDQTDVTTLCKSNFDCVNNAECIEGQCFCKDGFKAVGAECVDLDECLTNPCGPASICSNTRGSYHCECESGFVGTPPHVQCKAPCDEVTCGDHAFCKADGHEAYCICEDGWTFNPNDIAAGCVDINECDAINGPSGRCGRNAICTNTPGDFSCQCKSGFSGNAFKQCIDIDECARHDSCGHGATCTNTEGSYACTCPEETIPAPDPYIKCVAIVRCEIDDDCPGNAICDPQKRCLCPEPNVGNDCRHPCEDLSCGPNAHCMLLNDLATCLCSNGYTGKPGVKDGCRDIDECAINPCPPGAICNNEPGSFSCQCPSGMTGDPYSGGCQESKAPHVCGPSAPCPAGEQCIKDEFVGSSVCICQRGYTRDHETGKCRDINECMELREKPACGVNAICKNLPGSYECQCPPGFNGNPFSLCEECNSIECQCQPPYKIVNGKCMLAGCSKGEKCPSGAECITIAGGVSYCACPKGYTTKSDGSCEDINECTVGHQVCGYGAECINLPGAHQCVCPHGYGGDPYNGLCSPAQKRCTNDNECKANEKCVQPGECVCPPPFYTDPLEGNLCKNPCDRFPCGINARCTPSDPPRCMCEAGFEGDPQHGCIDVNECANNPCGHGAYCINTKGDHVCECPKGMIGDPYGAGCTGVATGKSECSSNDDCENYLACVHGSCVNPCDNIPCGPNAYCEPDKHAAWCRCVIGFTEGKNNECVSQCDGFVCGTGAQCIVSYDGPTCKCIEGFMGNPFPGGQCVPDVCSPEIPCAEPSVCISGRCKRRCEGVVCGIGAMCDPLTNKCVCNPYFVGNPDLLCMPPIQPPRCDPACGKNAHCEYGLQESKCICNPGTSGNPYHGCGIQQKSDCSKGLCGRDAHCNAGPNAVECLCPPGFAGNPYIQCFDINECNGDACGSNAVCINTIGSYDCHCKDSFFGNPFVGCQQVQVVPCAEPSSCVCSEAVPCPFDYTCVNHKCVNQCSDIKCGPRSVCQDGACVCPPGYSGNPNDQRKGCHLHGRCSNDLECEPQEICFQVGKGVRKCVDACGKLQCGPNALCVTQHHVSSCLCVDGYQGNPSNLLEGCQPSKSVIPSCAHDSDCQAGFFCIALDGGLRDCVNPCGKVVCGAYQKCEPDVGSPGHATCKCQDGYEWNPVQSSCEKPSVPDCISDDDCRSSEGCRPDALGVLKCLPLCSGFTCTVNSRCVAENHRGRCECLPGYTGNPDDRRGCHSPRENRCSTDSECPEDQTCRGTSDGPLACQQVCDFVSCGPNALCVVNNHVANCECPPGLYAGDPNDVASGCRAVPCVYNIDCPPAQLCNRLTHTCYDACDENACGVNAVCIADDHRAICQCPPGLRPNPVPDVECVAVEACRSDSCHPTALCVVGPTNNPVCKCPPNHVGDPYVNGCQPEGYCTGPKDCPVHSVCHEHRCVNPCEDACGLNALCEIVNGQPSCRCIHRFVPSSKGAEHGCVRATNYCTLDAECEDSVCLDGQCRDSMLGLPRIGRYSQHVINTGSLKQ
ncbi:PREDICTED: fibrillin-1-like [Dinoponera quadriceps]|uniref:Fibrillin-1-like n=1 Tax=Dinoponera quadriceps TaxID=609295 RepID=A0A6P3XL29_DINQU|nr:PREDICTED: fibrillin-1-like [Dinoponera quadriceps]